MQDPIAKGGPPSLSGQHITVGNRSFDLNDIDSVSMQRPILSRTYGYIAIGVGIVLAVVGYLVWNGTFLTPMLGGVALIIVGVVLSVMLRPHYAVRLNHASGDVTTVPFSDPAEAQRVITTISDAKSRRS